MLTSVFGIEVSVSWLMSSVCSVFWQIIPKRCDVKQRKKRHKHNLDTLTQTSRFFQSIRALNWCKESLRIKNELVQLDFCNAWFWRNLQKINHTSDCVTAPDLGDSLWQENKNPQILKIDKLVYSHAVNCLISKLTNHKLKVTGFPTTSLCFSSKGQVRATKSSKCVFKLAHGWSHTGMKVFIRLELK